MLFTLDYFEQNINSTIFYHWDKHRLMPSLKTKSVIFMNMRVDVAKHCFARTYSLVVVAKIIKVIALARVMAHYWIAEASSFNLAALISNKIV